MILYAVMALAAVLGFWVVWAFMDRFQGRGRPAPPPQGSRPWHEVLGVPADASAGDIRAAYLREIEKYHPDRVATMAPEFRALAEARSKEINRAYDEGLSRAH